MTLQTLLQILATLRDAGVRPLALVTDLPRTQTFRLFNDPAPEEKPNLLLCWRTSPHKSVVAVIVDPKGHPSTSKALARAGLTLADMDLIELNEAFAAQALAVLADWELPDGLDRVNVHGSGISLGHPVGATGCRILTTLLRELERREGRYGLETMCIGGGQGITTIFERIEA